MSAESMTLPESLRQDHAMLRQILEARQAVTMETLPVGTRIVWTMYLLILQDALKTVSDLIRHLEAYSRSQPT